MKAVSYVGLVLCTFPSARMRSLCVLRALSSVLSITGARGCGGGLGTTGRGATGGGGGATISGVPVVQLRMVSTQCGIGYGRIR